MHFNRWSERALLLAITSACFTAPVLAQSTGASGDYGNGTDYTGEGSQGTGGTYSYPTYTQKPVSIQSSLARLTPRIGISGQNGLPPCRMDSFVRSAGGMADLIYGDEGTDGPPPFYGFTDIHRIEAGIFGDTRQGLTTGHHSELPSAWGADEFLGAEWSQPNSGMPIAPASSYTAGSSAGTTGGGGGGGGGGGSGGGGGGGGDDGSVAVNPVHRRGGPQPTAD
ncbi:hypothetical protein BH10CYA1_BH10CYA1_18490 [soil metagenome]